MAVVACNPSAGVVVVQEVVQEVMQEDGWSLVAGKSSQNGFAPG